MFGHSFCRCSTIYSTIEHKITFCVVHEIYLQLLFGFPTNPMFASQASRHPQTPYPFSSVVRHPIFNGGGLCKFSYQKKNLHLFVQISVLYRDIIPRRRTPVFRRRIPSHLTSWTYMGMNRCIFKMLHRQSVWDVFLVNVPQRVCHGGSTAFYFGSRSWQ